MPGNNDRAGEQIHAATSERKETPETMHDDLNPMPAKRYIEYLTLCLIVGLPMLLLIGCNRREHERYGLAGKVVYNGQSVPAGYIVFTPQASAGNPGPGSQADIHDGKYATLPGQGTIGGPHVARIFAFDGKPYTPPGGKMPIVMGHPLFPPYTAKVDLAKQATTFDFTVPKN